MTVDNKHWAGQQVVLIVFWSADYINDWEYENKIFIVLKAGAADR